MHNYIHLRDSIYSTMKLIVVKPAAGHTVGTMGAFGLILPNQMLGLLEEEEEKKKTISMSNRIELGTEQMLP